MQDLKTVRRVVVRAFGGPDELTIKTATETPKLGSGDLLIEVEACGINYLDVYQRSGMYQLPLPFTPGFEVLARCALSEMGSLRTPGP